MKKSIQILSLLLMVLSLTLISCDGIGEPESVPEAVTASVKYTVPSRGDLLEVVDMTVYYTNEEGKEVSEVVTSPKWEKKIEKVAVPSICNLRVIYVRNDKPLLKDVYNFGKGLIISYITTNGNIKESGAEGSVRVHRDQTEAYLGFFEEEEMSIEVVK